MTTVVFDGKHLVADTLSTYYGGNTDKHTCPSCDGSLDKYHGTVEKIQIGHAKIKFKGQRVIAWGCAGNVKAINFATESLRKNVDIQSAHAILRKAVGHSPTGSIAIITDVSAWHVEIEATRVIYKEVNDKPIVLGSGSAAAHFALKFLDATAIGAVGVAMHSDEHTGGKLHYFDCRPEEGEELATEFSEAEFTHEEVVALVN